MTRYYSLDECREIARYAHEKNEAGGRWVTLEDEQRVFISTDGHLMPSGPGGEKKKLRESAPRDETEKRDRKDLTAEYADFLKEVRENPTKVAPKVDEIVGGRKPELVSGRRKTMLDMSASEANKPEANKPEANKPEANKPEANKPEANKPKAKVEMYSAGESIPATDEKMEVSFYKSKGGVSDGRKSYVAKIDGADKKYGFSREFLEPDDKDWSDYDYKKRKGTYSFIFDVPNRGGVFEVCDRDDKEIRVYFPVKLDGKHDMRFMRASSDDLKKAYKLLEKSGESVSELPKTMAYGKAHGVEGFLPRVEAWLASRKSKEQHPEMPRRYSYAECEKIAALYTYAESNHAWA